MRSSRPSILRSISVPELLLSTMLLKLMGSCRVLAKLSPAGEDLGGGVRDRDGRCDGGYSPPFDDVDELGE